MQLQKGDNSPFFHKYGESHMHIFPNYFSIHWLGLLDEAYIIIEKGWLPMTGKK